MQTVELLRARDAAAKLAVTEACIRRWILERRIATVRVGRTVRIPAQEIARLIEVGTQPAVRGRGRR